MCRSNMYPKTKKSIMHPLPKNGGIFPGRENRERKRIMMEIKNLSSDVAYMTGEYTDIIKNQRIKCPVGEATVVCLQHGTYAGETKISGKKQYFDVTKKTFSGLKTKIFSNKLPPLKFLIIRNSDVHTNIQNRKVELSNGKSGYYTFGLTCKIKSIDGRKFYNMLNNKKIKPQLDDCGYVYNVYMSEAVFLGVLKVWSDTAVSSTLDDRKETTLYLPDDAKALKQRDFDFIRIVMGWLERETKDEFGLTSEVHVVAPN